MKRLLIISLCLLPLNIWGATKLSEIDFEDSTTDSYSYSSVSWSDSDVPETIQYVTGHTGKALRSSHNDTDDGGGDFTLQYNPASSELYVTWWAKYEAEYACAGDWNQKWWWWSSAAPHLELIASGHNSGTNTTSIRCQLNGGVAHWYSDRVVQYGSFPYTLGDWMQVEIYIKQSTGTSGENHDGVFWVKINGTEITWSDGANLTNVATGLFSDVGYMSSPAIKADNGCTCASGAGWWQLDDYEVWDGMPDSTPAPAPPTLSNVTISNGSVR